ncbi:hypothetical protein ECG581_2908 [Escherichia coli G58-1]|nr:hypothetical protein ECG581_2908 [Escherichia coli G58-1]
MSRLPSTVAGVKSLWCSRLLLSARAWLDIEKRVEFVLA